MANFATFQSKGGTGKSTVSQQCLATYNLARFDESKIVEFDDQNLDSEYMDQSMIEAKQVLLGDQPDQFHTAVASALPFDAKNVVLDVGGNRTTKIVIDQLEMLTGRTEQLDAIAIPISDNRMGPKNAEKTLAMIKSTMDSDLLLAKCFLVLNRVRAKGITSIDNPSIQSRYRNVHRLAKKWKLPVLIIEDMDGIENLAVTGKTIYELQPLHKSLIKTFVEKAKKAFDEEDNETVMAMDDLQFAVNNACKNYWPVIQSTHNQLDKILDTIAKKVASLESTEEA